MKNAENQTTTEWHGEPLVERVVAAVEADPGRRVVEYDPSAGPWVDGLAAGVPSQTLASAVFPSGRPLAPSLRRWLAFDAGLLSRYGWFGADFAFTPRTLGQLARDVFGEGWGSCFDTESLGERFGECFLLPGGSDSRRVLATGIADEYGEYPVFALDIDDIPCIELMYPGFDVYLAHTAGVIDVDTRRGYSALADDARYGRRMRAHAQSFLAGKMYEDCFG